MKQQTHRASGFTLIELLVVIAVIGILAAVVLASLSSARDKGADASIQQDLSSVRSQAEIYALGNANKYGTFASSTCPGVTNTGTGSVFYDSQIKTATEHAGVLAGGLKQTTTTAKTTLTACVANDTSWAAAIELKSSNTSAWCVDSSGASRKVTITINNPLTAYVLTNLKYVCK